MSFFFKGPLSGSKSLLNRALICSYFYPQLEIVGDSQCDDVQMMKKALTEVKLGARVLDAGEAGTTFRFLSLLVSQLRGEYFIRGEKRLLSRPQAELVEVLGQFDVAAEFTNEGFRIHNLKGGWKIPAAGVRVSMSESSQFASAILLSAWGLPRELMLDFGKSRISESYLKMTMSLVSSLGMKVSTADGFGILKIPPQSRIQVPRIEIEPDLSSAFAIVALGCLKGDVLISNFPTTSLQPDFAFLTILEKMGVQVWHTPDGLWVEKPNQLRPISISLTDQPDLFPVLAALLAFSSGESRLIGAPHLKAKESDRIKNTIDLLGRAGVRCQAHPDGVVIQGCGFSYDPPEFVFDPDKDHRMAMAAAVFQARNPRIRILDTAVVTKSFPEFWKIAHGG